MATVNGTTDMKSTLIYLLVLPTDASTMDTDGRREQNDDIGNDVIGIIAGSVAAFTLTVAIVACLLICYCAKQK